MQELKGNMWDHLGTANAICITTNGFVKRNGQCVIGKGCALQAKKMWPSIPTLLGDTIAKRGNLPACLLRSKGTWVVSFPVKSECKVTQHETGPVLKLVVMDTEVDGLATCSLGQASIIDIEIVRE